MFEKESLVIQKEWVKGKFIKRYKRFFADVIINDQLEVAHVANTGSLKTVLFEGAPCLLLPSNNPERKLKFTLEALQVPTGAWVGINTSYPNQLAQWSFQNGFFSHWKSFDQMQPEYKISKETRLDLMLSSSQTKAKHFVEVKSVTLKTDDGCAAFPDAVTERGQKHLRELMTLKAEGHGAEILFVVQRADCHSFRAAHEVDPEYAKLLQQAQQAGVLITVVVAETSLTDHHGKIQLTKTLPLKITT